MSVRPILLKDIRRTAITNHHQATGSGTYNRFASIAPRDRSLSTGKRPRSQEAPDPIPKTPRLDANTVFAQLKDQDSSLLEAKELLKKAAETGEDCLSAKDGAIGSIIHSLLQVMGILLTSHENLTSAIVDSVKLAEATPQPAPTGTITAGTKKKPSYQENASQPTARQDPITPEEANIAKVKKALRDAEKKSIIFNLDMGPVPTINKDTLSRKVTVALSNKAKEGNHDYNVNDAEDTIDDVLSCSKLEFMGSSSRAFYNKKDTKDKRNGKFCTIPVRMDFKDKETRIQAEISLRKICKVSCSTPYPKNLRAILDRLVKEGKRIAPDHFIRTRVNADKLSIDVHAKVGNNWQDLGLSQQIPLDILNFHESQVTENMDSDEPPQVPTAPVS